MDKTLTKQLLLSNNYWVLNKDMVRIFGLETAFLLSNFAEAEGMMADKDGWFYQTAGTVEEMTTLSRHKQNQCIKQLAEKNILEKDIRGMPAKRYFRINYKCLTNLFVNNSQTRLLKIDILDCKKSATSKESTYKETIYKESKKQEVVEKTELDKCIDDFKDFRKKIKAPMTDRAVQLLHANLNKLASDDKTKIAILEQSIMNGWKGVFPLREDKPSKGKEGNVFFEILKEEGKM